MRRAVLAVFIVALGACRSEAPGTDAPRTKAPDAPRAPIAPSAPRIVILGDSLTAGLGLPI